MEELTAIAAFLLTSAAIAISTTDEPLPPPSPADKALIEIEEKARQEEQAALQAYEQKDFDFMQGVVYEPSEQEEQNGTQH